jgi:hypothetical protein
MMVTWSDVLYIFSFQEGVVQQLYIRVTYTTHTSLKINQLRSK